MSIFDNPYVRLAGRAVLSGALAAGAVIYASAGNVDKTVILAAAAAGIHALVEVFTPLNKIVGAFHAKDGVVTVDYQTALDNIGVLIGQKEEIDKILTDLKHKADSVVV